MVLAAALARSIVHARLTVPSRVQDDQIRILACVGGFKETSTCVFRSRDLSLSFFVILRLTEIMYSTPEIGSLFSRIATANSMQPILSCQVHSTLIAKRNRDTGEQIYIADLWRGGSRFSPQGSLSSLEISKSSSWRSNVFLTLCFPVGNFLGSCLWFVSMPARSETRVNSLFPVYCTASFDGILINPFALSGLLNFKNIIHFLFLSLYT